MPARLWIAGKRKQFLLRSTIVIGLLTWAYVASYARLYHRGITEINPEKSGAQGFLYVSLESIAAEREVPLQHMFFTAFYAPLNQLHRAWFPAYPPCTGMSFGLSRDSVPSSMEP